MLDPVLVPFVDAGDDDVAERALSELLESRALPLARAIVSRKLRSFRTHAAGRADAGDRDDVVGDAMAAIVERLWRARSDAGTEPIQSFERYVATVVHSECAHYIRRRHPERARLKNRLRYLVSTDRRLAVWTSGDQATCGLSEWRGREPDADAEDALLRQGADADADWMSMEQARLARAIVEALARCAGPVSFEVLVAALAVHVVEPREIAGTSALLPSIAPALDHVIDRRRFLEDVWSEVASLPVRQRAALLLNLRDRDGSGMLWLLPVAGVATIRQIARLLEIDELEFSRLWHQIPLDDAAIAVRLGCTRQQVINLRVSARKRLLNRVGPVGGRRIDRKEANLPPVSASLKGRS